MCAGLWICVYRCMRLSMYLCVCMHAYNHVTKHNYNKYYKAPYTIPAYVIALATLHDFHSGWLIQKQYGEGRGSYFRGRKDRKRGRTKGACMQELESGAHLPIRP